MSDIPDDVLRYIFFIAGRSDPCTASNLLSTCRAWRHFAEDLRALASPCMEISHRKVEHVIANGYKHNLMRFVQRQGSVTKRLSINLESYGKGWWQVSIFVV